MKHLKFIAVLFPTILVSATLRSSSALTVPSPACLQSLSFYNEKADNYFSDTLDLNLSHIQEPFLERLREASHILDLGVGSGRDSKVFRERGHKISAVDGSSELARLASLHLGIEVPVIKFHEPHPYHNQFDAIWANASLHHVPENELAWVINHWATGLKKDGIFYMSFPYDNGSKEVSTRFFTMFKITKFRKFVSQNLKNFDLLEATVSTDVYTNKTFKWLNVTLKKKR